jgi:hypothetical protein
MGGLLNWGLKWIQMNKKNHWLCRKSISLHRDHVGEHGGGLSARIFERKGEHIWVPFLKPEDIQILSLYLS